jgi:putative tricarboxylic transport membrane protein
MRKADRIFAVIGLGLALWSYLESRRFHYMTEFTPGPGFFPFWVGVCLALLSAYLIYDSYKREPSKQDEKKLLPEQHALVRVAAILAMLAAATGVMKILGFPLTLAVFTTAILLILEHYSIVKSVAYGIAYAAVTWFIFEYMMTMGFPKGFLGI